MIELGSVTGLLTELLKFAQKFKSEPLPPTPPQSDPGVGAAKAARMARIHQMMTEYRLIEIEAKASVNLGMSMATFGFLLMLAMELDDETDRESQDYKDFEEAADKFFNAGVVSLNNGMEWYAKEKEELDRRVKDL